MMSFSEEPSLVLGAKAPKKTSRCRTRYSCLRHDFETLCKKFWGEIWECPQIKKNSRSGKIKQHGVDIYGIPNGENQYFGIQCKGKDSHTNKQLTKKEIYDEIKNAKEFQPPLKKLYLATTANKNGAIEEYVRKKDIENRANGLFEIHLFSWGKIEVLIDENEQTHDWYLKSQNFKLRSKVNVTFQNGSEEMEAVVPFLKRITHYKRKHIPHFYGMPLPDYDAIQNELASMVESAAISNRNTFSNPGFNNSWCRFKLCFQNVGDSVIENRKATFDFNGDFDDIDVCQKGHILLPNQIYNIRINADERCGDFKPFPKQLKRFCLH